MSIRAKQKVSITDRVLPGQHQVSLTLASGYSAAFRRDEEDPVLYHDMHLSLDEVRELEMAGYDVYPGSSAYEESPAEPEPVAVFFDEPEEDDEDDVEPEPDEEDN